MSTKKLLRWMLVLVWLALIIYLSYQSGAKSAALSNHLSLYLKKVFDCCGLSVSYASLHLFVRKLAHFVVHLILSWLMYAALDCTFSQQKANIVFCMVFCVIVALFDEYIQVSSPGRAAQLSDGILNLFGVQSGIIFGILTTKNSS